MISQFTWPNHDLPSDKEAVKKLLEGCGFGQDTAYGKTKVFIRTPRTLFSLEEQRADMVQRIVLFLQKVRLQPLWWTLGIPMLLISLLKTQVVSLLYGYVCVFTRSTKSLYKSVFQSYQQLIRPFKPKTWDIVILRSVVLFFSPLTFSTFEEPGKLESTLLLSSAYQICLLMSTNL